MSWTRSFAPLLLLLACSASTPSAPPGDDPAARQVLFIGNSLTYWNDLPARIAAVTAAAGGQPLQVTVLAKPDYGLGDHWAEGEALRLIRRGGWEYVVLQQGPSTLPESRADLRLQVARFAAEIRKVGAVPTIYGVWPDATRRAFLSASIESYRLAADDVDGLLIPAARAWHVAWTVDSTLGFYADGLHPSTLGAQLVALTFAAALDRRVPMASRPAEIPAELHAVLVQAAATAAGVE